MGVAQVTDSNFHAEVLNAGQPVLVDFYADWCGPCKALAPVLDQLANDKGDKIKVVKVNIDENPMKPTEYGVRSIPTLMIFKDGKLAATKIGSLPKGSLYDWVDQNA